MFSLLYRDSGLQLAGDVRMSILLVVGVLDLCGRICRVAEMVLLRLDSDQNVVHTPRSREFAPLFPLLSHPPVVGQGQRGWEGNGYLHHCRCCFSMGLPAPH